MTTLIVLPATVVSDSDPVGLYNLADRGSRRGSGYWFTNAILRHCDKLFATWQSYDPSTNKYAVWVGTNQLGTSIWLTKVKLAVPSGYTMDDHGGASIIADKSGYLHLLYGSHNTPMLEAISVNPWDASAFRPPSIVPTAPWVDTTYSSLVRNSAGTLHLVYRGRNVANQWRLIYQRGTTNLTGSTMWQQPRVLASTANGSSNATGYSLYDGAIAVNDHRATHALHIAYQMYSQAVGAARSWGYLRSNDGGNTWTDWLGITANPPVDTSPGNTAHLVQSSPAMDVRICNVAIDPSGDPWISVLYLAPPGRPIVAGYDTQLWRLSGGQWSTIPLSPHISSFGPNWRIANATITFDSQGVLYVAAERVDMNDPTPDAWFNGLSKEVILLVSTDMGQTFQVYPISPVDPTRPHWLANIERATTSALIPIPSILYADGSVNSPNPGGKATDIVFVPFYKH